MLRACSHARILTRARVGRIRRYNQTETLLMFQALMLPEMTMVDLQFNGY